jgi:hypothetical protein
LVQLIKSGINFENRNPNLLKFLRIAEFAKDEQKEAEKDEIKIILIKYI